MAHQYSRVGFKSSVEVNEVNLSLSYGGVMSILITRVKLDNTTGIKLPLKGIARVIMVIMRFFLLWVKDL